VLVAILVPVVFVSAPFSVYAFCKALTEPGRILKSKLKVQLMRF